MLAGRPPFQGTNALAIIQAVLTATPAPIRTLRPDVAPELEEVVSRTLVRDRDRRTITAADVRDLAAACHARLSSGAQPPVARPRTSRRTQVAAAVVALAVVASGVAWWAQRNAKVRWARQEALPEIIRLAEADKFDDAYPLAQQAQPYIPDDPLLAEQIRAIYRRADIDSDPPGADVFYRPYGRSNEPWRPLGKTPIADARCHAACCIGKARWLAARRRKTSAWPVRVDGDIHFTLFPANQVPAGMVRIASRKPPFQIFMPGLEHLSEVTAGLLDRSP